MDGVFISFPYQARYGIFLTPTKAGSGDLLYERIGLSQIWKDGLEEKCVITSNV